MQGPTMGTQYKIVIKSNQSIDSDIVRDNIESILEDINNQMSTYDSKSEISVFNNLKYDNELIISSHFYTVLEKSLYYYELSDGMFDITIHPLYELWGFQGKSEDLKVEPSKQEVDIALNLHKLKNTGFSK